MLDVPKFTTFSPEGCLQAPAYDSWRKDNTRFEELELYYSDGMIGSWIGPSSPREFIDNLMLNHKSSEGLANMPDESVEFERPTTDRPRDAKAVLNSFVRSLFLYMYTTLIMPMAFAGRLPQKVQSRYKGPDIHLHERFQSRRQGRHIPRR